jgi:hypothetical protein
LWAAVHDALRASLAIECARRDDRPAIEHSSPLNAAHHQVHVALDPASSQLSPFLSFRKIRTRVSLSEYLNPAPSGNNIF